MPRVMPPWRRIRNRADTVTSQCPDCRGPADHAYQAHDENQRIVPDAFTYFRCRRCGLIFLHPAPDNLGHFYPQSYYALPATRAELARDSAPRQYQVELVRRFVKTGRLLDVGPGHGAFAFLAKEAGFEVATIELDAECCAFLRDVVGVPAIQSNDPAKVLPQFEPQDVITLWHVVEHLPDPWATLSRAVERLAPGGILVIATPNPQSLQFGLFGSRWVHLDAPRHVRLLPAHQLVRRLVSEGLQPLLITTGDPGGRALDRYGWRASLINLSERRVVRAAGWRMGVPLGWLATPLERTGLRGSAYTAVFRKPGEEVAIARDQPDAEMLGKDGD